MTGLLYTHFHDNINFLNNPSYLKSEKPVCCINFLQQLTLYRLSLLNFRQITKQVLSKFSSNFEETLYNLKSTFKILVVRNPWDRLLRLQSSIQLKN